MHSSVNAAGRFVTDSLIFKSMGPTHFKTRPDLSFLLSCTHSVKCEGAHTFSQWYPELVIDLLTFYSWLKKSTWPCWPNGHFTVNFLWKVKIIETSYMLFSKILWEMIGDIVLHLMKQLLAFPIVCAKMFTSFRGKSMTFWDAHKWIAQNQ